MTQRYTGTIAATPPFDFAHSLAFLGEFPPTAGEQTIAARSLTKAVLIDEVPVAFTVSATGTADEPGLAYTLHADTPLDPATIARRATGSASSSDWRTICAPSTRSASTIRPSPRCRRRCTVITRPSF